MEDQNNFTKSVFGKKRISKEEYDKLSDKEKFKFKFMVFDEDFNPGCGDDIALSYQIAKMGLLIYQAPFWVDHHRLGEHINEDEKIKEEHGIYFRKKHKLGEFKTLGGMKLK